MVAEWIEKTDKMMRTAGVTFNEAVNVGITAGLVTLLISPVILPILFIGASFLLRGGHTYPYLANDNELVAPFVVPLFGVVMFAGFLSAFLLRGKTDQKLSIYMCAIAGGVSGSVAVGSIIISALVVLIGITIAVDIAVGIVVPSLSNLVNGLTPNNQSAHLLLWLMLIFFEGVGSSFLNFMPRAQAAHTGLFVDPGACLVLIIVIVIVGTGILVILSAAAGAVGGALGALFFNWLDKRGNEAK